jgi:hypothetical protein
MGSVEFCVDILWDVCDTLADESFTSHTIDLAAQQRDGLANRVVLSIPIQNHLSMLW